MVYYHTYKFSNKVFFKICISSNSLTTISKIIIIVVVIFIFIIIIIVWLNIILCFRYEDIIEFHIIKLINNSILLNLYLHLYIYIYHKITLTLFYQNNSCMLIFFFIVLFYIFLYYIFIIIPYILLNRIKNWSRQ